MLETTKEYKAWLESLFAIIRYISDEKLDDLKREVDTNKEMLSDIAMSTLMKGETVEVKDEYDNVYEPAFKVNFKKANAGSTV